MQRMFTTAAIAGAMVAGMTGSALATQDDTAQLRAEMAQMQAEIAQLRAETQGDWLTEARADEVRGLVSDVLADAETRASLLQEGMMAGIDDGGHVFLQSADGQFSMNIGGQIQFRYLFNNMDDRSSFSDENHSGFNTRRTKVWFNGTVADGWDYTVKLSANSGGDVFVEDVIIGRDLGDGWDVQVGVMKLPFARQELISSTRQVAVDRALTTEHFTLNRAEQINLGYENDQYRFNVALSDGANTGYSGGAVASAVNDFAITARVDVKLDGEWSDAADAFGNDTDALFIGGAVHYEKYDGDGGGADDLLAWTVDALWKTGQFGVLAAIYGSSTSFNAGADVDQFGLLIQGDYKVDDKWDVFARWEHLDGDTAAEELAAITFGANHHFNANVKFTADVVWVYSGDSQFTPRGLNGGSAATGLGTVSSFSDDDDQIALRAQLQLLF